MAAPLAPPLAPVSIFISHAYSPAAIGPLDHSGHKILQKAFKGKDVTVPVHKESPGRGMGCRGLYGQVVWN
ncbi:hypothetical protein DSCA_20360 [Desulfosarcina alkanivorans]|uniref:Uncharacterized protein n=1 Tax=Desulfosarcina alkanivorans TaxID=571177 RepID=A0A5K7YGA8_9BACT|nr:hypothetical protein DSCA_20360 [Desulfosarcina alkanivorans]